VSSAADAAARALRRSLVAPERDQHSVVVIERRTDVHAFGARVMASLERMERRGLLTSRQCRAGERVYQAYVLGIVGARDADAGGSSAYDPGGIRDRQLDAATEYRRARDVLGTRMWPIVWHVVCDDWSVERFANECSGGTDRKGCFAILRLALDVLADHYGL
jgi:hypothetical protein